MNRSHSRLNHRLAEVLALRPAHLVLSTLAHLRTAVPAVGGAVQASPPEVAITFTEGVEPRFSTIEVQDAAGQRVDRNDAHTAPADNKVFSVGVPQLAPGIYTVVWHATAVDTHKTEGTFQFTVKP